MSATWAAFAHGGKPEHPSIPPWPAYTLADRATLVLDNACHVVADPGRETRLLWQEITGD